MIASNDDIAWALNILDKIPISEGTQGEQQRAAYRTIRKALAEFQQRARLEKVAHRENLVDEIGRMYKDMPSLPITRDNLNYERAEGVNAVLDRVVLLHTLLFGDGKAGLDGRKIKAR